MFIGVDLKQYQCARDLRNKRTRCLTSCAFLKKDALNGRDATGSWRPTAESSADYHLFWSLDNLSAVRLLQASGKDLGGAQASYRRCQRACSKGVCSSEAEDVGV